MLRAYATCSIHDPKHKVGRCINYCANLMTITSLTSPNSTQVARYPHELPAEPPCDDAEEEDEWHVCVEVADITMYR
jgi:hypothetical protein